MEPGRCRSGGEYCLHPPYHPWHCPGVTSSFQPWHPGCHQHGDTKAPVLTPNHKLTQNGSAGCCSQCWDVVGMGAAQCVPGGSGSSAGLALAHVCWAPASVSFIFCRLSHICRNSGCGSSSRPAISCSCCRRGSHGVWLGFPQPSPWSGYLLTQVFPQLSP